MSDLITRSELLTYCPGLTSMANTTLDAYISAASVSVESYCHREFASKTVTERHPFGFSPRIYLKHTPVTVVSNVTLYTRYEPASNIGNVTNDYPSNMTETSNGWAMGYAVKPSSGMMTIDPTSWRVSSDAIRYSCFYEINYTGGYANIPEPVKAATAKLVETMSMRWSAQGDFQSEKVGDYSYTKFQMDGLISPSSDVGILLGPYVKVGVNGI